MNAEQFKKLLAECRSTLEVERLLQVWHTVKATFHEFQALRDAVVAKMESLAVEC